MNKKQQGDIGVAQAIAYYTLKGYDVSIPLTDSTRYDLIIDNRLGRILRVQVKTTNQFSKYNVPVVTLSTQGGNQSWDGSIRRITAEETDLVFVYSIVSGTCWEFPVADCVGKRSMSLGVLRERNIVRWGNSSV